MSKWKGRLRHAWEALHGRCEAHWSPEQCAQINYEMAEGIIAEMGEVLSTHGCCHGHDIKSTPPMFYPEMMLCALAKAKRATAKAK